MSLLPYQMNTRQTKNGTTTTNDFVHTMMTESDTETQTRQKWWQTAPIYVINLQRSTDRWKRWKQFPDIHRVNAVDMGNPRTYQNIMSQSKYVSLRTVYNIHFSAFRYDDADINTGGAIGATLSHYKVLLGLAQGTISSPAFVFEDDAALPKKAYQYNTLHEFLDQELMMSSSWIPSFLPSAISPQSKHSSSEVVNKGTEAIPGDDFDIFLLGHVGRFSLFPHQTKTDKQKGHRVKVFMGMHAVVYTRQCAQRILPWLLPVEGHIDAILSRASQLGMIRIRHHPTINFRQVKDYKSTICHTKSGTRILYEKRQQTTTLAIVFILFAAVAVFLLARLYNRYKKCESSCERMSDADLRVNARSSQVR